MLTIILALLAIIAGLLIIYIRHTFSYWERRGIAHEKPLPLLGNMKGLGTSLHLRDIFRRVYNKFKGKVNFTGIYIFMSKTALILDLELAKHVLIKDFAKFHDRGIFINVKDDPLTGHLLALEGENWKAMRAKLTAVFTSAKMRYMLPSVVRVGKELSSTCQEMIQRSINQELEIRDLCARYTTDVIGTCVFGLECSSLQDPEAEFHKQGRSITETPRHNLLVETFMFMNPKLAERLRMKFVSDSVSDFFLAAVRSTIAHRIEYKIQRNDFMDLLIELKAENENLAKNSKYLEHGLTIEEIAAQAFVFFVAGFDTSSSTMSCLLYELAQHTDIQEKLRQEIIEVLSRYNDEITYESVQQMHYLEQVLLETLRKYPILPDLLRIASCDYHVPNSTQVIEKGVRVIIPVEAIHNDPEYYPEPQKFIPERFTPEAMKQRHFCAYLPFGEGPRNCIGMRFGKMQSKVGVISLLREYKFSISKHTQIPLKFSNKVFLLSPESGIHLRVEALSKMSS